MAEQCCTSFIGMQESLTRSHLSFPSEEWIRLYGVIRVFWTCVSQIYFGLKHSFFCIHTTPELILSVFAFLYSGNSCLWSRLQLFSSTVWNMMFSSPTEWSTTRVRASVHWTGTRSPFLMRFYPASSALRGQCVRFMQRWAPLVQIEFSFVGYSECVIYLNNYLHPRPIQCLYH